jgi:hypothetical protein
LYYANKSIAVLASLARYIRATHFGSNDARSARNSDGQDGLDPTSYQHTRCHKTVNATSLLRLIGVGAPHRSPP